MSLTTPDTPFAGFDAQTASRIASFFDNFVHGRQTAERFDRAFKDISDALLRTLGAAEVTIWVPDLVPAIDRVRSAALRPAWSSLPADEARALPLEIPAGTARAGAGLEADAPLFHEGGPDACPAWTIPIRGAAGQIRDQRSIIALAEVTWDVGPRDTVPGAGLPAVDLAPEIVDLCGQLAGRALERAMWAEQEQVIQKSFEALDAARHDRFAAADSVASAIADAMQFEACSILLADPVGRTLLILGTTGIETRRPRRRLRYRPGYSCSGRVAAERRVLVTEDLDSCDDHDEPLFTDRVETPEIRQYLGMPVLSHAGELLGVVRLRNKRPPVGRAWPRCLHGLDLVRARRTAGVLAPLMSLMLRDLHGASVLERVRHDMDMPAMMIRDSAGYFRRLSDEQIVARMDDLRQKLEDFESLGEILLLNSELLQVHDAHDLPFEPEHIMPMGEFVAKLCKMLTPEARRKGLAGVLYVDDTFRMIPKLWLDGRFMQIALYNLLQNGIKYSNEGTFIVVEAEVSRIDDRPWYQIHVRNTGIGIVDEQVERVFDRNYRTPRAVRKHGTGLGIGLSIARAMVERHGGRLVLTRQHDPTVFTIQLPGDLAERKPR